MNKPFSGIIVPVVTPYKEDLSLDLDGVEKIFAHFDSHPGLDGLFITGATGEYDVLTMDERKRILDVAVGMRLKKDWVPNTTALKRDTSVELTRYAASKGIGTIGVILPQECRSFSDVRAFLGDLLQLGVSIFIYQTGNSPYPLSVEELGVLVEDGGVVGMKDSCSPSDMTRHIYYIMNYGNKISVIQGVEDLYLCSLSMGGHGVIGGGCNVYPQLLMKVRELYRKGLNAEATAMQTRVNRQMDLLYEEGTGNESMKYFLSLCGVPVGWASRKTQIPVSDRKKAIIRKMYEELLAEE
jgi:2-dehydro-3-deoxy-D-pentonate aldolase